MSICLNDLLSRNIFDSYKVISAQSHLDREVTGVSILETPDFEKYIIDGTMILTTFYIINKNVELFQNLIITLSNYHSPGIAIKLHRYIDDIPEIVIEMANQYNIPILVLDYDANLSIIYNTIYAELQSNEYLEHNFHSKFVSSMAMIEKNPSTAVLIESTASIDDLELLIYNYDTGTCRTSAPFMEQLFEQYKNSKENYFNIDDNILYKEDIYIDSKKIYMFMIYTTSSKRHIIHTYSEIYNILIVLIYQKKKEIISRQDLFLVNFVSNYTAFNSTNQDMIYEGKLYNWNIEFPVVMILFTFKDSISDIISSVNNLPNGIKDIIMRHTACQTNEIKYIFFDNKILFIENDHDLNMSQCVNNIYQQLSNSLLENRTFTIAYTSKVYFSKDLPAHYRNLIEASNYITDTKSDTFIISPMLIEFIKIIKEFNSVELNSLLNKLLAPLTNYEKDHDLALCNTLLMYYKCHFNLRETAQRLYIHYNTLKYRLAIIEKLGYDINSMNYDYTPLLLALYMHSFHII